MPPTRRDILGLGVGGLLMGIASKPASAAQTAASRSRQAAECLLGVDLQEPTTLLDEVAVNDNISYFNHHFARPEAPDTKNWDFNDADITKQGPEIELASTATIESTQRGNYPPGKEATAGWGWRLTGVPTAGEAKAGYVNGTNGFGSGEDTTDSFVFLQSATDEYKVYRPDWNGYHPDSRLWVSEYPVITRGPHLYYGEGPIRIRALVNVDSDFELRTLHTFDAANVPQSILNGPLFNQPNQPVAFETNGLTGGSLRANAAHYEVGQQEAENRVNGMFVPEVGADDTDYTIAQDTWTHICSYRKRDGWEGTNVKPLKIAMQASTNDVRLSLHLGTTLSNNDFTLPENTSPSETAVEVNTDPATDVTSLGEQRWVGDAKAGQGNQAGDPSQADLDFNLPAGRIVSLVGSAVGGSASVTGTHAWEEFF